MFVTIVTMLNSKFLASLHSSDDDGRQNKLCCSSSSDGRCGWYLCLTRHAVKADAPPSYPHRAQIQKHFTFEMCTHGRSPHAEIVLILELCTLTKTKNTSVRVGFFAYLRRPSTVRNCEGWGLGIARVLCGSLLSFRACHVVHAGESVVPAIVRFIFLASLPCDDFELEMLFV